MKPGLFKILDIFDRPFDEFPDTLLTTLLIPPLPPLPPPKEPNPPSSPVKGLLAELEL